MGNPATPERQVRYAEVVQMLIEENADPRTQEKGLMEVSAGFREVFFGYMDALELMIQHVNQPVEFLTEQGFFNGYTRLIDASLIGRTEAIELLLRHETGRSIRDIEGFNGWTARNAAEKAGVAPAVLNRL
jgi:hypothetical protein